MRSSKHKNKKRSKLKIAGIVILILLLAVGIYGFMVYRSVDNALTAIHKPLDREKSEKRTEKLSLKNKEPFSVLLLGVDERTNDKGRSDTMIVLTVNPKNDSMEMLSIPRDTMTEIVGHGTNDKINHAYAFGGIPMSIATVENFTDIPIDYYIKINMEGFKDIVNAVDGVDVNNDLAFSSDGFNFPKKELSLNGKEALAYARMRHEDPRGDFGRQLRQRQVIEGVINKGASLSSLWNYNDIFKALGNNVETNLTLNEMVSIQKNYGEARKNIQQFTVKGEGQTIDNIWYYIVSEEEKQNIQDRLKKHLEIK
jgi:LCP family protein required for cell wall assembly